MAVGKVTYVVRPGTDENGVTHDPVEVTVDQNQASGWTQLTDVQLYRAKDAGRNRVLGPEPRLVA